MYMFCKRFITIGIFRVLSKFVVSFHSRARWRRYLFDFFFPFLRFNRHFCANREAFCTTTTAAAFQICCYCLCFLLFSVIWYIFWFRFSFIVIIVVLCARATRRTPKFPFHVVDKNRTKICCLFSFRAMIKYLEFDDDGQELFSATTTNMLNDPDADRDPIRWTARSLTIFQSFVLVFRVFITCFRASMTAAKSRHRHTWHVFALCNCVSQAFRTCASHVRDTALNGICVVSCVCVSLVSSHRLTGCRKIEKNSFIFFGIRFFP